MLIVRLNNPAPGEHIEQVPSVEKVPLPDRVPKNLISSISALSGTDDNAQSATSGKRDRITHLTWCEVYHS
jgi:hypothetical protein